MKIELKVGSRRYAGWENVTVTKSMQSIAHSFSMDIFNGDNLQILDDDVVQILKDGKPFLTGYCDEIELGISDTKKPLKISGRSKTCDLIDCNIENNKQYNKQTIVQIISDLVKPFGLSVSTSLTIKALSVFNTKIGETYFDAINRLCKQTNTLPISDSIGNIIIVQNLKTDSPIILKDQDFKELTYPKKLEKRFSKYVYKKEGVKTDISDAIIKDTTVKRYRPFVAVNTEDKTNQDLALWEKNKNKAEEENLTAIVYGWDLEINTIVKLETAIVNNSFLIKEIEYSKGDAGTVSKITLVQKDLFDVISAQSKRKKERCKKRKESRCSKKSSTL